MCEFAIIDAATNGDFLEDAKFALPLADHFWKLAINCFKQIRQFHMDKTGKHWENAFNS